MYEAQPETDWKNILNDSCCKLVCAASENVFHKVKGYIHNVSLIYISYILYVISVVCIVVYIVNSGIYIVCIYSVVYI